MLYHYIYVVKLSALFLIALVRAAQALHSARRTGQGI